MIQALIFDFDGLILDTETPELDSWQAVYREYGQELQISAWIQWVGGAGASGFDPVRHLESLTNSSLNADAIKQQAHQAAMQNILQQSPLPGVKSYLDDAKKLNLGLAIASSSPHSWVDSHLKRLGLYEMFDHIVCADDVARTKPHPDLFVEAAHRLNVPHNAAVVFEDSQNGVKAANSAGIYVVAVPNPVTQQLGVLGANRTLKSLADLPLSQLLAEMY